MSLSVLPVVCEREQQLKLARRRGARHLAVPTQPVSSKSDHSHNPVRRSKSEQRLPELARDSEIPTASGSGCSTLEERKDRIKSLVTAIESQRPSVAFSGHKAERRRPGSGSSVGSRSYHSLCAVETGAVPRPVKPAEPVLPKKDARPKLKKGTISLKVPTIGFNPARFPRKTLPPAKKTHKDPSAEGNTNGLGADASEMKENTDENGQVSQKTRSALGKKKLVFREVVKKPVSRPQPRHPLPIPADHKPGVVPKYLKKRQAQWHKEEEEERRRQEQLLLAPPGFSLMSEAERKQTLDDLKKREEELVRELVSLPVRIDTIRIQRRKLDIENQLSKIDEGIRMFSRPKVFVRHEDEN